MAFALKEWAVVCDAMLRGEQFWTLRKGGIEEEEGEFKALYDRFYLYPTLEHQKPQALRPEFRERLSIPSSAPALTLRGFAHCEAVWKVESEAQARRLSQNTVWTEEAIAARFHLYPKKPLVLMALRVYRLETPIVLPEDPSYAGCRSWVPLIDDGRPLENPSGTPIVDAHRWEAQWAHLKDLL